jgi:hypothetical protein
VTASAAMSTAKVVSPQPEVSLLVPLIAEVVSQVVTTVFRQLLTKGLMVNKDSVNIGAQVQHQLIGTTIAEVMSALDFTRILTHAKPNTVHNG